MTHVGQSILVVDGLTETAEVLRAVFEPRGHAVRRLRQAQLAANPTLQPSVVVWHGDELPRSDGQDCSHLRHVPRIVIGKARVANSTTPARQLSQPFQYRELLDAIELLLNDAQ